MKILNRNSFIFIINASLSLLSDENTTLKIAVTIDENVDMAEYL